MLPICTLSLDEMRFGDYDNVPVNSTRQINKKADFSECLGTELSACRHFTYYWAEYPPSMTISEPVMYEDSSEARNSAAWAISIA